MELQTCAFIQTPNTHNCNYETFSIHFVIMCLLIIYITALSLVLILKQPIENIKEVEIIKEIEEEEVVKEEVQTQVTNEEEEVIVKEVVKVDVQTQVTIEEEEIERKKKEQKREQKKEEELLLANYNAKERALALQAAYVERANLAFEKWQKVSGELHTIQQNGHGGGDYLAFMTRIREEYLETNEKLTRVEAFNALKKTNLLGELPKAHEFAHLFNS